MKLALAGLLLGLLFATSAWAHGGGLDRNGCHTNRRTGDYHCHRAPAATVERPQALSSVAPPSSQSRDMIVAAQTLLNHLGCNAGTADGVVGAQTQAAANRFVAATGRAGGRIDAGLVRHLAEAVAAGERC